MAVLTANDFAQQMVAQLRLLDPSISAEVGTPERKIIDTVAQALADNQVDLTGLQSALDIDGKFGANLDRFTGLFGMQRQQAAAATGFVVFSRNTPAPAQVTVPSGLTLQANLSTNQSPVQFITTTSGTIALGQTASNAIPIRAVTTGAFGNVGADTITSIIGNIPPGITSVTNPNALTNGLDAEDDNSFKVRFKNTWARNLAGTEDQFLALALAGTFTTKAVVIGDQSRFQEYIQVPNYDDVGRLNGAATGAQNTFGTAGYWTSALSSIPYAKQLYTNSQTFLSNGQQGIAQTFYSPLMDFVFNYPPRNAGDALRDNASTTSTGTNTIPTSTFNVTSTSGFPTSGTITAGGFLISYTGKTSTTFTGCASGSIGSVVAGTLVYSVSPPDTKPNFTFLNVFNPSTPPTEDVSALQALAPGDIALSEFGYISTASRNDLDRNITNAVDVYVDGSNDIDATVVLLPRIQPDITQPYHTVFATNPISPWYYENYRRDGNRVKRPHISNYITPMFQAPIDSLPSTLTINSIPFALNVDYWLVREIGPLGGSVRARDGIEWNVNTSNIASVAAAGNVPLEIPGFAFDTNIVTIQAATEAAAQITTDVLVHKAITRYFKLDITIMYSPNTSFAVVNTGISTSVQAFFDRQYFGTVIQLSDLLETIHEVSGVDNVRWSNDLPVIPNLIRVLETDRDGNPLHGVSVDKWISGGSADTHTLYSVGYPSGLNSSGAADSFTLTWTDGILPGGHMTTAAIPFWHTSDGTRVTAADIQSAITAVAPVSGIYHGITVTEDVRPTTNVDEPIRSFTIMYGAAGTPVVPTWTNSITQSDYTYDSDYFLLDHELPSLSIGMTSGDTLPGLIIRPRAQNTFVRPGLG